MSKLIVIADPLTGARHEFALTPGEMLADVLMRLWPAGIDGAWRIYRDEATDEAELAAVDLPLIPVIEGETYILVRTPLGPLAVPIATMLVSMLISYAVAFIMRPDDPRDRTRAPEEEASGTNQVGGQRNRLRLGQRIPDILGCVRCYPDLLCAPIETWWIRTQNVRQFFIIGLGDYDIPEETVKLGETPHHQIVGATYETYHPGMTVPPIQAVKEAPEVGGISLLPDEGGSVGLGSIDFAVGPPKTMTSPNWINLPDQAPITISGSLFNNGVFWVVNAPTEAEGPPYVWTLQGSVVNELDANAAITPWEEFTIETPQPVWYGTASPFPPTPTAHDIRAYGEGEQFEVAEMVKIYDDLTANFYGGLVDYALHVTSGGANDQIIRVRNLDGNLIPAVGNFFVETATFIWYRESPSRADPRDPDLPQPSAWYTAPMLNPDEIWVDIAFPQGLKIPPLDAVLIRIEFKRAESPLTSIEATADRNHPYKSLSPLRFTHTFNVAALGLPAGSGWIQVRVTRVTPMFINTTLDVWIQDTRWQRLIAVRNLEDKIYTDLTCGQIVLANTKSAVRMGETNVNMIVTRRLPTWSPVSGWSAVDPLGTRKWADNFVARCKAGDGAQRTDAQVDLAGIYALQTHLDSMDGGKLGQIGIALDTVMDVDAELAVIADLVRASVYRVGPKIYVTRDEQTATRIALFNARTKKPEAETVAVNMTGETDSDCALIQWVDEANGFKRRTYKYPEGASEFNPHNVSTLCANWETAWRRGRYEWLRLKYRREVLSVTVTEDGRICRPGDVIAVTDDTANLAQYAGEVLYVSGLVLTLDRDVSFGAGTYTILLRDVHGQTLDAVPCVAVAGSPNRVQLSRAPLVTIQGRGLNMGTLYAFYADGAANARPWIVTGMEPSGPYVALTGANYNPKVYQFDTGTVDPVPPLEAALGRRRSPPPEVLALPPYVEPEASP